ncbi:MAG: cytochrome c peroxidase [Planctomycetota bacterium]
MNRRSKRSHYVAAATAAVLAALAAGTPAAAQLGPVPAPAGNPITPAKAVLGKMLFWDEQLSSDNTISCGTCHIPSAGGVDPRTSSGSVHPSFDGIVGTPDDINGSFGVTLTDLLGGYVPSAVFGFENQVTHRQSVSHIASGYFGELFWDGRAQGSFDDPISGFNVLPTGGALENQAIGPILNDVEMARPGRTWLDVTTKLADPATVPMKLAWMLTPDITTALSASPTYPLLFRAAFGPPPAGTPDITPVKIAFALATYMRTQVPDQTPWDDFMRGLPTLSAQEQNGLALFSDPTVGNCAGCHAPPLFGSTSFHNLGIRPPFEDVGRVAVTGNPADLARFRATSLRGVGLRKFFFHTGAPALPDVAAVLAFYEGRKFSGIPGISPALFGINMTPAQQADIEAFLLGGLTDPRVAAETPPFDRPRVHTERAIANPTILGAGTVGAGGITPQMLAETPPFVNNGDFKVGVFAAEGGASAQLVTAPTPFGPWTPIGGPIVLGGVPTVPGDGFGTAHLPPPTTAMVGLVDWMRWEVLESSGALVLTPMARMTYF